MNHKIVLSIWWCMMSYFYLIGHRSFECIWWENLEYFMGHRPWIWLILFNFFNRQNICTRYKFQKGTKGLTMSVKSLFFSSPSTIQFSFLEITTVTAFLCILWETALPHPQQMVTYHAKYLALFFSTLTKTSRSEIAGARLYLAKLL